MLFWWNILHEMFLPNLFSCSLSFWAKRRILENYLLSLSLRGTSEPSALCREKQSRSRVDFSRPKRFVIYNAVILNHEVVKNLGKTYTITVTARNVVTWQSRKNNFILNKVNFKTNNFPSELRKIFLQCKWDKPFGVKKQKVQKTPIRLENIHLKAPVLNIFRICAKMKI